MTSRVIRTSAYFVAPVALLLDLSVNSGDRVGAARESTLTPEQWREDLRYLAEELPRRHLNAFHEISPDVFAQAVDNLNAEIPALPDHVIATKMMKLVAMIGDAHTSLDLATGLLPLRRYPIIFSNREDGLFVTGIQNIKSGGGRTPPRYAYSRAIGARLVRVGDMEVEQAIQLISGLASHDPGNTYNLTTVIPSFIRVPELLNALGIMPDMERGRYVVEESDGRRMEIELTPFQVSEAGQIGYLRWPGLGRWSTPLVYSRPDTVYYWYEYLVDNRTMYFRYRFCVQMDSLPFAVFWREVTNVIETNEVDRLVIDLRDNPGGNSGIFQPYLESIRQTPRFNQRGKLFVLINNGTDSSAMIHANSFQLLTQAILIGEPSGGKPNSYGELGNFNLPNSGLKVNYSTKFFRLRPNDDPSAVMPEILVEYPWMAYQLGRDPVLEMALNY